MPAGAFRVHGGCVREGAGRTKQKQRHIHIIDVVCRAASQEMLLFGSRLWSRVSTTVVGESLLLKYSRTISVKCMCTTILGKFIHVTI